MAINILVVDDEEAIADLVEVYLKSELQCAEML